MTATYDLTINQGISYSLVLRLKQPDGSAIALAGFTGKSQIRRAYGGTLIADLGLQIDTSNNLITLSLGYLETSVLPTGTYVWDLFLADAYSTRDCYLRGNVRINGKVTEWV